MTEPIAAGRDADVFALDDGRVPRRYRRPADVSGEAARRRSPAPSEAILHQDLHPESVLITGAGLVVIDWCNARTGPADLDTALSALAQPAIGSIPRELIATAGEFLDRFSEHAPATRCADSTPPSTCAWTTAR